MPSLMAGLANLLLLVQLQDAAVSGTIRDAESAAPLSGAVVTLIDIHRSTATDGNGRYVVLDVPAGPHHVSVRRIGYRPRTLHAIVPVRGTLAIDIALEAEPVVLGTVEVTPAITIRGVEEDDRSSFPDRTISVAAVRNHPMLAEPDVFLALGGGEAVLDPESPSGIHLRGGASDQTAYALDGIPVLSPYHAAGTFSAWNPDALERLRISSSGTELTDALSGVVTAETRAPGSQAELQGSISTSQWRATADGPLGLLGGGYVVSYRAGFPDALAPGGESSYLNGETSDALLKLELPALGGALHLLGYESENEIGATAAGEEGSVSPASAPRNAFEWRSQSIGASWGGEVGGIVVHLRSWRATSDAAALWDAADSDPLRMAARREDHGVMLTVERRSGAAASLAGIRHDRRRTAYRVRSLSGAAQPVELSDQSPVTSGFVSHERRIGSRLTATLTLSAGALEDDVYSSPRAELRWSFSRRLTITGSYARTHQFSQSLRNSESLVGNVFPVDLFVGSGRTGVPVARGHLGLMAAEYRTSGARVGAQLFARRFDGLLLVAPRAEDPFVTAGHTSGSGIARGLAIDASLSRARWALVGSYAWQRVRVEHHDSAYAPEYGASQLLEGGVIIFPSATSSIRLGLTSLFGRRATPVSGIFEWESCNVYDRGCELVGTPRHATDSIGAQRLPPYVRLDLGVRKHWHLEVAGRDAMVALFGTVTNVLGRKNLMAMTTDPKTGERTEVEMRSRVPLVVGLDWRF